MGRGGSGGPGGTRRRERHCQSGGANLANLARAGTTEGESRSSMGDEWEGEGAGSSTAIVHE